ncbi:MAG TPA: site-2 protease family protein [Candidatus Corynebacterium avicola]|uniref:Zinc metalloprotease Rip1 n=1 Tax=Candidatus Corynebacterium avicola TaxID=2838527 RepID=A0A9D1UM70_9CORY|nr:site-2 protease family protein [Candidatus Corynebacterium avicola]
MDFWLGVLLFALGIGVTIALHEAGHMMAARVCGMRVRRYFIGFGPTVWSTTRGHTEYGLKAVPLGGFCDIAGMTLNDPWTEEEEPYLMIDRPAWQRLFVMFAGIIVNITLGVLIIFGTAVTFGLPSTQAPEGAVAADLVCSPATQQDAEAVTEDDPQCTGDGAAAASGVQVGDLFVEVDGTKINDPSVLPEVIQDVGAEADDAELGEHVTVPAVVQRDGTDVPIDLQVEIVEREGQNAGAIGVSVESPPTEIVDYNPITAIGGTADFTWYIGKETVNALLDLPERYWPVVQSIFGGERQPDSPVSVVGASHAGGQLVEQDQWMSFLLLLANLNFFLAVFNMVPLPPLDGGHAIVVVWEKIRDWIRRKRGLEPGGPVDYVKLMPLTYVATAVLLVFGLTVIVADVVNPLRLF